MWGLEAGLAWRVVPGGSVGVRRDGPRTDGLLLTSIFARGLVGSEVSVLPGLSGLIVAGGYDTSDGPRLFFQVAAAFSLLSEWSMVMVASGC